MAFNLHTPGFICAYHFVNGRAEALGEQTPISPMLDGTGWVWLHVSLTDNRCQRWLKEELGIFPTLAERFCQPATRQLLADAAGLLSGFVADFQRDFDADSTGHAWLHFLAGHKLLITGRSRAVQSAERIRLDIAHGWLPRSPIDLLGRIITKYADTLDAVLYRLLSELELIEDHVLEEQHHGERRRLMLVRREAAQLHRHMRALRRALLLADRDCEIKPPQLPEIAARLANHDQDFDALEVRARFFHDEIDAKLAAETNRQLYILSALTALFLPPSLVAGLFGMNVSGSPLDGGSQGFWLAVVLCAVSSGAVSLFLWGANRR